MKSPRRVVELVDYDDVVREFANVYYIIRQSFEGLAQKAAANLEANGIDDEQVKRAVQASVDAHVRKTLEHFAAGLRLPPKAEVGREPEEGVEYRVNYDMSWVYKAAAEAFRPPPELSRPATRRRKRKDAATTK